MTTAKNYKTCKVISNGEAFTYEWDSKNKVMLKTDAENNMTILGAADTAFILNGMELFKEANLVRKPVSHNTNDYTYPVFAPRSYDRLTAEEKLARARKDSAGDKLLTWILSDNPPEDVGIVEKKWDLSDNPVLSKKAKVKMAPYYGTHASLMQEASDALDEKNQTKHLWDAVDAISEKVGKLNSRLEAAIVDTEYLAKKLEKITREANKPSKEAGVVYLGELVDLQTDITSRLEKLEDSITEKVLEGQSCLVGEVAKELAPLFLGMFKGMATSVEESVHAHFRGFVDYHLKEEVTEAMHDVVDERFYQEEEIEEEEILYADEIPSYDTAQVELLIETAVAAALDERYDTQQNLRERRTEIERQEIDNTDWEDTISTLEVQLQKPELRIKCLFCLKYAESEHELCKPCNYCGKFIFEVYRPDAVEFEVYRPDAVEVDLEIKELKELKSVETKLEAAIEAADNLLAIEKKNKADLENALSTIPRFQTVEPDPKETKPAFSSEWRVTHMFKAPKEKNYLDPDSLRIINTSEGTFEYAKALQPKETKEIVFESFLPLQLGMHRSLIGMHRSLNFPKQDESYLGVMT